MSKSLAIAYAMKKKHQEKKAKEHDYDADDRLQGVHKESHNYGDVSTSHMGAAAKSGSYKEGAGKYQKGMGEANKEEAKRIYQELKSMPNPKLKGLADGGQAAPDEDYDAMVERKKKEQANTSPDNSTIKAVKSMSAGFAKGGEVSAMEEDDKDLNQHHVMAMNSLKESIVDRIMNQKSKDPLVMMSEGGKVANECDVYADELPNEFDDLVLRDDLESDYDGANAGDHLGNSQEDQDRKDIVAMIMKSRAKKDRNPRPA